MADEDDETASDELCFFISMAVFFFFFFFSLTALSLCSIFFYLGCSIFFFVGAREKGQREDLSCALNGNMRVLDFSFLHAFCFIFL